MSEQDLDLVPSDAADEQAISVPASPPRRDPVEDADASFTRKRPRLDSGRDSLRAMSTDPDPNSPAHILPPPHDKQVEMTIRPHPPSSPVPAGDDQDSSGDTLPEDSAPSQRQSPIVILSSEDELGSPPVMIVEDDEPEDFAVQLDAEDYFRRFPCARLANYAARVRDLSHHISSSMSPLF